MWTDPRLEKKSSFSASFDLSLGSDNRETVNGVKQLSLSVLSLRVSQLI